MTEQQVAGRYTLQREIGRGAHGAVWSARDEVLDREVALKRLGVASGWGAAALRAEREARLAAQVAHPHVVAVYDLVTVADDSWLVMEYVAGRPLSELVRDAPLSPDEAARLLAPVADALAEAHRLGIVHRDIKPSNILAGPDGAKLTDFGIARGSDDATLTRTGLVTGSPAYLAPEVARGGHATTASDVWSIGATLVHLLTGRPPYHRADEDNGPLAVAYRIAHEPAPTVPAAGWLAPLLARTMAQDPHERPSMAEVRDHLDRTVVAAEQTMVLPAVPPSRRTAGMVAAAVATVVVALVLAVLLLRPDGGTDRPAASGSSPAGPSASTGGERPSVEELTDFARTYVETAAADPSAGFAMLTRSYQRRSPDYLRFWGSMRKPAIVDVNADPEAMTVTYRYTYVLPREGRKTERVTLRLVAEEGVLLIDDATTVAG